MLQKDMNGLVKAKGDITSLTTSIAKVTEEIINGTRALINCGSQSKRIENQPFAMELLEKGDEFTRNVEQLKRENVRCDYALTHEINLLETAVKAYKQIINIFSAATKGEI